MSALATLTAVVWLGLAPPADGPREPSRSAASASSYEQALTAVREATVATNIDPIAGAIELDRALTSLLDHAPTLAVDPSGRELQLLGELALARAALDRDAPEEAAKLVDQLLTALILADELDELGVDRLGPRLDALVQDRAAAAPLAALARLRVRCPPDCRVYIDGRAVAFELATGPGAPLTPGTHEVWVEAEGRAPLREAIAVAKLGETHELRYASAPPPRFEPGPSDRPAPFQAAPKRLAPRWAEAGLIGVGAIGIGVGAALASIHGRCIGGGSTTGVDACPDLHNTRAAGITSLTLGATTLLTSTILLAIDEKRRSGAKP